MDPAHDKELAALLALAQQGDRRAYEKFLLEACPVLRRFIARRMRPLDLVEDVLQDTLLTVHRALRSHLPGRPVGPWLYTICEHRMIDLHRRRRRSEGLEISEADAPAPMVEEPAAQSRPYVLEALRRLPGRQRHVIELLKLQELSVREVAARIGMSESAVKVTAFRGYEAIRKMVGVSRK